MIYQINCGTHRTTSVEQLLILVSKKAYLFWIEVRKIIKPVKIYIFMMQRLLSSRFLQ